MIHQEKIVPMDSILQFETSKEMYFIFIQHLQSIKIAYSDETPYVKFALTSETIRIPISDLWQVAKSRELLEGSYERDLAAYENAKAENLNKINRIVLQLSKPHIAEEHFKYRQSSLTYRQAKPEVLRKLTGFVFNCLNYFWANFDEKALKYIKSVSIPSVTDIDRNVEHFFVSLTKDIEGFDVHKWYSHDFSVEMVLQCFEQCVPALKPVRNLYRLSKEECYAAATDFVKKINQKVQNFYTNKIT